MANAANLQRKQESVKQVTELFDNAQSIVLIDYRGLTVEQVTDLRNQFREGLCLSVNIGNRCIYTPKNAISGRFSLV